MTINSYFYDSVANDRPYSAADFAKAFGIILKTGVMAKDSTGALGLDIGGTNYLTIYAGKAIVQGHFIEVTGTETLTVPAGTYLGQVVLRVDDADTRTASLVVKTDRTPIQGATLYELPLFNANVTDGIITAVGDMRIQGGAATHTHLISEVSGLQTSLDAKAGTTHSHDIASVIGLQTALNSKADDSNAVIWSADPNGVKATIGKYNGTGKPIVLFLTTNQPSAVSTEHRVWIQIDNF